MKKILAVFALMLSTCVLFSACLGEDPEYSFADVGAEYQRILTDNDVVFNGDIVSIKYVNPAVVSAISQQTADAHMFKKLTADAGSIGAINTNAQFEPVLAAAFLPMKTYSFSTLGSDIPVAETNELYNKLENFKKKLSVFYTAKSQLETKQNFNPIGQFEQDRLKKYFIAFNELNMAALSFSADYLRIYTTYIFVSVDELIGGHLPPGTVKLALITKLLEFASVYANTEMQISALYDTMDTKALANFLTALKNYQRITPSTPFEFQGVYEGEGSTVSPYEQNIINEYTILKNNNAMYHAEQGIVYKTISRVSYQDLIKTQKANKLTEQEKIYLNKINDFKYNYMTTTQIMFKNLCDRIYQYNTVG